MPTLHDIRPGPTVLLAGYEVAVQELARAVLVAAGCRILAADGQ